MLWNRKRAAGLLVMLAALAVLAMGADLLHRQAAATHSISSTPNARGEAMRIGPPINSISNLADGGEGAEKSEALGEMTEYFKQRLTYPTGNFNPAWVAQASKQDKLVQSGIPAGRVTYRKGSESPLDLNPNSWVSLGPHPQETNGCRGCYTFGRVSGRANAIVVDPASPNIAYLGTGGGGVWKSSNCCAASTTWTLMTDDPLINLTAIDDVAIDPNNHNLIYAATGDKNYYGAKHYGSQGILKSTDQGATWTVKGADVFSQTMAVSKARVDPRNSNTIIAGTIGITATGVLTRDISGVYFSYNGGDGWTGPCYTNANTMTQRQGVTDMVVTSDATSTTLYVAIGSEDNTQNENGANGVYSTTVPASGCPASWTLLNSGWPAGTGNGTPGGTKPGRIDLGIAPSDPNYIYAQVANVTNGTHLGVWRTTDQGATWSQRSGLAGLAPCQGGTASDNQGDYDQALAVDPNNRNMLFMGTVNVWRSTDGGASFADMSCVYGGGNGIHPDQQAITYKPGSSSTLLVANDGGAYVTVNATTTVPISPTWNQLNNTLNTIEFYSGDITSNFANAALIGANGGAQDNGVSGVTKTLTMGEIPGPMTWQMSVGGDGFFAHIEPVLGQSWYQGNNSGQIRLSTTGNNGPQTLVSPAGRDGNRRAFAMPFEIFKGTPGDTNNDCPPTGCTHLILGTYRVYEATDGATGPGSWYINSPDLTKGSSYINQLSYSPSFSTTIIVGTNDGNVQYLFGMGQGTANSSTRRNVTGGNAVLPNRPILDVATDPMTWTIGYAAVGGFNENTPGTPGHVFRVTCSSNDQCATSNWVDKTGNLPNIPIDSIIANPNYTRQVFAGSDWGLYYTNDVTANPPIWFRFNNGLPNVQIWDMQIDRGNTTLSVWTRARGAYVWPLPSSPIVCGTAWNVVSSPNIGANGNKLWGVAAASATDIWAVGYYRQPDTNISIQLIEHWNGGSWSVVSTPFFPGADTYLRAVAVVSANDVWAVGSNQYGGYYTTLTEHWDGTQWSVVPSPNPNPNSGNELYAVTAIATDDVWAVGSSPNGYTSLAMHWNGTNWAVVPTADSRDILYGVAAVSANNVWAVGGNYNYSTSRVETLVEHWDGSAWSVVPSPNPYIYDNSLDAIAVVAANDIWAVGHAGGTGGGQMIAIHWDGTQWTTVLTPPTSPAGGAYSAIAVVSANDIWATVGDCICNSPAVVEHWDGTNWSIIPHPYSNTAYTSLRGISAVSANDVWAVGFGSFPLGAPVRTLIEHYSNTCAPPTPTITPTPTRTPTRTRTPTLSPTPSMTPGGPTNTPTAAPCGGYAITQATDSIVPGVTDVGNHCDDCATNIALPFTYNLYGRSFTSANVDSDGTLEFTSNVSVYNNTCLPNASYNNAIFPHWDDLRTDTGTGCSSYASGCGVFTSVSGSAPNRIFNVEWRTVYYSPSTQIANFEVRLYEGQNRFDIVYGQVGQGGSSATVGVQNGTGPQNTQFECNTANTLSSGLQLIFSQTDCSTPTNTPTSTPTVANLIGHVTWQGAPAQPDPRQQQPLTLTLKLGSTEYNFPSTTTDASGYFTVSLNGLLPGNYSWRVKGTRSLANCGSIALSGGSASMEMGLMRTGDANNDNVVNTNDFNVLRATFGSTTDLRADFDNNGVVGAPDFNLLRGSFGQAGCVQIGPAGP